MLTVYSKETTSFSTLGIGVLRDFLSNPLITEELNGAYTLEFQYAKDGYLSEYLIEQNIIKANGQAFRIWNIKKDMQKITVLAKHIFFDLSFNFLSDVYPKNLTAQGAFEWLLNRAAVSTNFSVTGNCTTTASGRYVRKTFIDAIFNEDNALVKRFGGELSYDNFNITVHEQRGSNANFSIRYKKNLTGIDFNLDFSNVATRIVPIGFDGLTIDSTYVESSRVGNYFTPLYKTYEFSDIKYDPDDEEAYQTLAEAKQALTVAANNLFSKGVDLPQISIGVNFVELAKCTEYANYSNLESVHLGDTIKVIIPELNIDTTARVNKTVYDCILERFTKLEIGSAKQSVTRTQINIENQIKKSENFLTQAQQNAENLINHPFNGNIIIDKENGVLYLMDTNDPATAQSVWKWSLGGLGYSSTGINGTYTVAILQDGRINADFITTGQLNTGVIQGYDSLVLQVQNIETEMTQVSSVEGTSFELTDSGDAELTKFELEGKTTQADTPTPDNPSELVSVGYQNLYEGSQDFSGTWNNSSYWETNNETYNGLVVKKRKSSWSGINKDLNVESGKTYTFSVYIKSDTARQIALYTSGGTSGITSQINYTTSVDWKRYTLTFTATTSGTIRPRVENTSASDTNYTYICGYQLEEDTQAHSYIPYGKYGIEIETTNSNLIGLDTKQYKVKLNVGDKITLKNTTSSALTLNLYTNYGDTTRNDFWSLSNNATRTITVTRKSSSIAWVSNVPSDGVAWVNYGSSILDYEEHKDSAYLYTLDNPLRSIGNYKDKLYIENGMLYIERKIGSVVLDGSEEWGKWDSQTLTNTILCGTNIIDNISNVGYVGLSNYFVNSSSSIWDADTVAMQINGSGTRKIRIRINKTIATTSIEFKTWLSTHNTEVQYVLSESVIETLGTVNAPITYNNISYITLNDKLNPNMKITYVRDTEIAAYVENYISQFKMTDKSIESRVSSVEESTDGLNSRTDTVEATLTTQGATLDIISTNIDTQNGDVKEVTTTTGFTFNAEGMTIADNQSSFKAQHKKDGTYYYDGTNIVGQYTKDGSKQKDLDLFGVYTYGKNDIADVPMFVAQLYTDEDGEECFGHFYNRGE